MAAAIAGLLFRPHVGGGARAQARGLLDVPAGVEVVVGVRVVEEAVELALARQDGVAGIVGGAETEQLAAVAQEQVGLLVAQVGVPIAPGVAGVPACAPRFEGDETLGLGQELLQVRGVGGEPGVEGVDHVGVQPAVVGAQGRFLVHKEHGLSDGDGRVSRGRGAVGERGEVLVCAEIQVDQGDGFLRHGDGLGELGDAGAEDELLFLQDGGQGTLVVRHGSLRPCGEIADAGDGAFGLIRVVDVAGERDEVAGRGSGFGWRFVGQAGRKPEEHAVAAHVQRVGCEVGELALQVRFLGGGQADGGGELALVVGGALGERLEVLLERRGGQRPLVVVPEEVCVFVVGLREEDAIAGVDRVVVAQGAVVAGCEGRHGTAPYESGRWGGWQAAGGWSAARRW